MTNQSYLISLIKRHSRWLVPLLLLVAISPFTTYLDTTISSFFYQGSGKFWSKPFLNYIFDYLVFPAETVTLVALIIYVGSFLKPSWKKWRPMMLTIVLTLGVGSGVIVHLILKDHWGRPRPRQTIEFGGTHPYQPFYQPNFANAFVPNPCRSFPCGHCSLGFAFFSIYLLGMRYHHKTVAVVGLTLTGVLGSLLSFGRIAQGGHYFSDILVSALIMWWTALSVDYLVYLKSERSANP